MSQKRGGYTIVEIMIVVVVFAALVGLATFTANGLMVQSRDNQRKLNMQAVASKLEMYYKKNIGAYGATYPTVDAMRDNAVEIVTDESSLESPARPGNSLIVATSTGNLAASDVSDDHYIYQPFDQSGGLCIAGPCVRFVLYYYQEQDKSINKIDSLRQQ